MGRGICTRWAAGSVVLSFALALLPAPGFAHTVLGIEGTRFTFNGRPTFLLEISYFGGLGAVRPFVRRDLDDLHQLGFNALRVWVDWNVPGADFSAVDDRGRPRQPYFGELLWLVRECDRRGFVVDVTLARGAGPDSAPHLPTMGSLRQALRTIIRSLRKQRNWYLDLANERNVPDRRYVSFEDLRSLHGEVRQLDPGRLLTASHGGDVDREEMQKYLFTAGVDFICPHRPRDPSSPALTQERTREYLGWMQALGQMVPIHYQEPFRRGYGNWQPLCRDYLEDAGGAREGGAAGWCLHNGSQARGPARSFDLRKARLLDQLDDEERCAAEKVGVRERAMVLAVWWIPLLSPTPESGRDLDAKRERFARSHANLRTLLQRPSANGPGVRDHV